MSIRSCYSGEKSIDEILVLTDLLYSDIKRLSADKARTLAKKKYSDLEATFPLVIEWICATKNYHKPTMDTFLRYYGKHISEYSLKDTTELQLEYAVGYFRYKNPTLSKSQINDLRKSMVDQCAKEKEEFKEILKSAKEEVRKDSLKYVEDLKRKILDKLLK